MKRRQILEKLTSARLPLIPVELGGKRPLASEWQKSTYADNDFNKLTQEDVNVGGVLGGASGIVDVDLDHPFARAIAAKLLPRTGWVFGRQSSSQSHWLYAIDGDPGESKRFDAKLNGGERATIVEYRSTGGQTVMPPSIHASGERIEWAAFDEIGRATRGELLKAVVNIALTTCLSAGYQEGQRQSITLAFAGAMAKSGLAEDDVLRMITALSNATCDTEVSQRLGAVGSTYDKHNAGLEVSGWTTLRDYLGHDVVQKMRKWVSQSATYESSYVFQPAQLKSADVNYAHMGKIFADSVSKKLCFVRETGAFRLYEAGIWEEDIGQLETDVLFDEFIVALQKKSQSETAPALLRQYRDRSAAQRAIKMARPHLAVPAAIFDANPLTICCNNGVLDLTSATLLAACPEHYCTKKIPIDFDPAATCPLFETFLDETFGGNVDLINYVQCLMGYFLTGNTDKQEFYVFYGMGANGKSTFLQIIEKLLCAYYTSIMPQTIFETRYPKNNYELASLVGRRLVVAQEAESDMRLNGSLLKSLTGDDTMPARAIYGAPFAFKPTCKLVIVANHRPDLKGGDPAIARRVKLVPFDNVVPPERRDPKLFRKLGAELPGILNFAAEGAKRYLAGNMVVPDVVRAVTKQYLEDFDTVDQFLKAETVKDPKGKVQSSELTTAYLKFCSAECLHALNQHEFRQALKQHGLESTRGNSGSIYRGVSFRSGPAQSVPEPTDRFRLLKFEGLK